MSPSNIREPFVLATYISTLRGHVLDKALVGAYASVHQRSNNSNEYVTVAAQADAVHILDVSDLHPVISHTLGPSTYYSCSALSLSPSKTTWMTYAVISSSPELASQEDAGRTIYMWRVNSASKEKQQSKITKTLFSQAQTIHGLYACDELEGKLVALSCAGDVMILEAENLEVKSNWLASPNGSTVQYAWLLSMTPKNIHTKAFMIVIYSGTSNAHLRILAIDETYSISLVKDENIELPVEKIISAACNASGYLSILTIDGLWFLYNLLQVLDAIEPTSLVSSRTKPLHLANFSWLNPPSPSTPRFPVTTMSLTSSHVLLATSSSHEITILIWDLQFGVLLASYNLPIPASLTPYSKLHLSLVADQEKNCKPPPRTEILPTSQVSAQAYLLVSSVLPTYQETSGAQKESKITSVVFVISYTVPRFSTISAAMGLGTISQRWLKDDHSDKMTTKHGKEVIEGSGKNKLLMNLRAALQEGRTQAAEAMFLKWTSTVKEEEETNAFGYNFVQELLTIVFTLPSDLRQGKTRSYPAQIIHHLIERGVISSAMLTTLGGLLSLLRTHGDWKSIELAFNKVCDLTEMETVETLKVVLTHHRVSIPSTQDGRSDAMQIDTESAARPVSNTSAAGPIPLETYLHLMVNYSTTRIPLVLAFRRQLQDPEDITTLLRILSSWFAKRSKIEEEVECRRLLPSPKDVKKTTEGVWIVTNAKRTQEELTPSLEKITNYISTLLDSSFLLLLSYQPSYPILRTISSQITPELAFIHAAQDIRGRLEPFAILQERTLRESLIPKAEKEKEIQKVDWRQRKKGVGAAGGGPGADVGIYTLEELVI